MMTRSISGYHRIRVREMIPLVNLKRQYSELRQEIGDAISDVLESQEFINGSRVRRFSENWISTLGACHGAACANGTSAISLALQVLGIGPGDEVITVAHTFAATAEAIVHVGARPRFVDIEPGSYTMDVDTLSVGPRTRAIMPVHLYGTSADMDAILHFADRHGLIVIEDTAQAHLAAFKGRVLGTLGDAGTFSFFPGKNLGAYGDAGFIVFRDSEKAQHASRLLDHGRQSKYVSGEIGYNQRMDEIQAAVLNVKLNHLQRWTDRRRTLAKRYDDRLRPAGFKVIEPLPGSHPVYHLYIVEVSNRATVMERLRQSGISSGIHYPVPLHLQPAFKDFGPALGALSVTERVADRILSLPICGSLTEEEVDQVSETFLACAEP